MTHRIFLLSLSLPLFRSDREEKWKARQKKLESAGPKRKKKANQIIRDEWEELQNENRLLKKLKQGKITKKEFEIAVGERKKNGQEKANMSDSDEDEMMSGSDDDDDDDDEDDAPPKKKQKGPAPNKKQPQRQQQQANKKKGGKKAAIESSEDEEMSDVSGEDDDEDDE